MAVECKYDDHVWLNTKKDPTSKWAYICIVCKAPGGPVIRSKNKPPHWEPIGSHAHPIPEQYRDWTSDLP